MNAHEEVRLQAAAWKDIENSRRRSLGLAESSLKTLTFEIGRLTMELDEGKDSFRKIQATVHSLRRSLEEAICHRKLIEEQGESQHSSNQ